MIYLAKPTSRREIRMAANLVRKIQGDEGLYFDIMRFLEQTLPIIQPGFSLCVKPKQEMGECHGLTFPEQKEIWLREDIYDGAMEGKGRDRLTAAHELFHLLFHAKNQIGFARTGGGEIPAYKDPEWQADAFGGELLIPYDKAMHLTIPQIIASCGVSEKAARFQFRKMHSM